MTKKLCTFSGCRVIVEHDDDGSPPRCPEHKKIRKQISQEERKRKFSHHFDDQGRNIYQTYRWKKLRKVKAAMNPLCEHCAKQGIATPLQEVDHIHEIEDGGAIWDIENLQSLCRQCHKIKTDKCKAERNGKRKVDGWGFLA